MGAGRLLDRDAVHHYGLGINRPSLFQSATAPDAPTAPRRAGPRGDPPNAYPRRDARFGDANARLASCAGGNSPAAS